MSSRAETDRLRKILVATDGSPTACDAVGVAADVAVEHGAELIIVHVVPLVDVTPPPAIDEPGPAFLHVPSAYDHEVLENAAALAAEHGVVATTALVPGSPADEIVSYSESHDVDLLVVGSHGHGAVLSFLEGSVARGVMRASERSVLVVRPKHLTTTTRT
jgi:nucleotide-binding universal stress UspA family protein